MTVSVANYLTNYFFVGLREQESELILGALESGPIAFAKLQSAELSQQVLTRLMESSSLTGRGVESVVISGGGSNNYIYSQWKPENSTINAECALKVHRNFKYADSINPFLVDLTLDTCTSQPGGAQVRKYFALAMFVLFAVMSALLLLILRPLYKSMVDAENILSSRDNELLIENISFLPIRRLATLAIKSLKLEKQIASVQIAQQVAHDIRSPLSALEMISTQLTPLSEDKRTIIRNSINRIRDIANSLSEKKNHIGTTLELSNPRGTSDLSVAKENEEAKTLLLTPIIDSIVTEKRLEYRHSIKLNILFDQSQNSYGLFAKVKASELKRTISNIINNSVESLKNFEGKIEVFLDATDSSITISIVDNGKGIPKDLIPHLGTRGATFNKIDGSGLGLSHAFSTIEDLSGTMKIISQENFGTVVKMNIPRQHPPSWFVSTLKIPSSGKVVILDDDQTIHQIWHERIEKLREGQYKDLIGFSNPDSLRGYFRLNYHDLSDAIFLIDFEILGQNENGLNIIAELGIQSQAYLVTSHYENSDVRDQCEKLGVKLIPKSMSGFIPIIQE